MIITIIRGLPGSGKSTFARELSKKSGAILIEPDMFLTSDTKYQYDENRYFKAKWLARQMMTALACSELSPDIIYADVLPRRQDVDDLLRYVAGGNPGIRFGVFDTPLISKEQSMKRNIHHVRPEDLDRMIRDWESYDLPPGKLRYVFPEEEML
ncbi:MAG: AAA family ATPase [Lentisphaeria bacterium]|nr:AAA family ATPase [Lentisphaeria bacterium]